MAEELFLQKPPPPLPLPPPFLEDEDDIVVVMILNDPRAWDQLKAFSNFAVASSFYLKKTFRSSYNIPKNGVALLNSPYAQSFL